MSEQKIITEDIIPAQEKRGVVIVGRFQPPTIGHYKLINAAKKFIRENKNLDLFAKPIVVIIDGKISGQNKKVNPLTVEERISFMKHSGRANGAEFYSAHDAFSAFVEVRNNGIEPVVIGAGSDRLSGYIDLLNEKFLDKKGKKQKHYELTIETRHEAPATQKSLDKIGDKDIPVSSVSATLARTAAKLDYFDEFVLIVGMEKNIPAAKKMFKLIKSQVSEEEGE